MIAEREQDGQRLLLVEGVLEMDQVAGTLAELRPRILAGDCTLDFTAVRDIDSSALALVLALLRAAGEAGHRLRLTNMPESFNSLAALYGVDALLAEYLHAPERH